MVCTDRLLNISKSFVCLRSASGLRDFEDCSVFNYPIWKNSQCIELLGGYQLKEFHRQCFRLGIKRDALVSSVQRKVVHCVEGCDNVSTCNATF